jgi:hypothetical protein
MPPSTSDILDAIFLGWLMLLIAVVALAIFSRRHFRAWIIWMLPPLLAFPLSFVWWNLWMYHGWMGTPRIIHAPPHVSGESSYDATQIEMIFILCGALLFAAWLFSRLRRRQ